MSASWKRTVIDEYKVPYKKSKNDRLSSFKGLSVRDFPDEDDEFNDFDSSISEE
jgi:hypothetical protein